MAKLYEVNFQLQLPDNTKNSDARLFVMEALQRFVNDVMNSNSEDDRKGSLSEIAIPKQNDIEIKVI